MSEDGADAGPAESPPGEETSHREARSLPARPRWWDRGLGGVAEEFLTPSALAVVFIVVLAAGRIAAAEGVNLHGWGGIFACGVVYACALGMTPWLGHQAECSRDRIREHEAHTGAHRVDAPRVEVAGCEAWKVAELRTVEGRWWLAGMFQGHYTTSAEAVCPLPGGENHTPPEPGCTCGFHAWKNREAALAYAGSLRQVGTVVLRVELSGEILEYEEGYRAAGQDVLGVELWDMCRCGGEAVVVGVRPLPVADLGVGMCAACARTSRYGPGTRLGELAGALGTEVAWMRDSASWDCEN